MKNKRESNSLGIRKGQESLDEKLCIQRRRDVKQMSGRLTGTEKHRKEGTKARMEGDMETGMEVGSI